MTVKTLQNRLRRLCHAAGETADQVGAAARVGAIKVGQTAENAMMYTRLRVHVVDLRNQVRDRLRAIGELVYATHTGNPSDSEEMQRLLREIDGLKRAIAEDEQTMANLRGIRLCPSCGTANPSEHTYCDQCGQPLRP